MATNRSQTAAVAASAPESEATALLNELKQLGAEQQDALFACGGCVELDKPVRIQFTQAEGSSSSTGVTEFPSSADSAKAMDDLVAACEPATFGRGKQLVLDTDYRAAFAISTDRFLTSFHLSEYTIISEIHAQLVPAAASVRAKLYKLNIYKQGGFFKSHVDTPRGGSMFGSLVVCLPSEFTGGDFEVEHDGQKHVFAWGNSGGQGGSGSETESKAAAGTSSQPPTVRWCAFYSDCRHEVLEVTSGHRVTLTYLLENDEQVPRQVTSAIESNPFVVKLAKLLKTKEFGVKGQQLGFALEHKYAVDAAGTVPMLKGFDRFVKAALDTLGLQYKFAPVFLATAPTVEKKEEEYDDYDEKEWLPQRMIGQSGPTAGNVDACEVYVSDWKSLALTARNCIADEFDDKEFLKYVLNATDAGAVRWIVPPKKLMFDFHAVDYGNSPVGVEFYATAAFLVTL